MSNFVSPSLLTIFGQIFALYGLFCTVEGQDSIQKMMSIERKTQIGYHTIQIGERRLSHVR
jgi:hypothetical protein